MVNFVAGIVYAFVIMRNDNYASRYERVQLAKQCKTPFLERMFRKIVFVY